MRIQAIERNLKMSLNIIRIFMSNRHIPAMAMYRVGQKQGHLDFLIAQSKINRF